MNPLSKLIISVCAQCDWSWHHLSFWAIDGLNLCVIKYCPCSSTELSKHDGVVSGSGMPLSLLGLFKHSRSVCSAERAAQEPGSGTVTQTAREHQDTTAAGPENERILSWHHTSAGRYSRYNEYKSEAWVLFPDGSSKPSTHKELR